MGLTLECQKCGREWEYHGNSEYYATCPNCKTSVKITENKENSTEGGESE